MRKTLLSLALLLSTYADMVTTACCLECGRGEEANPMMEWVIGHTGTAGAMWARVSLSLLIVFCYHHLRPYWPKTWDLTMAGLALVYGGCACNNLLVYLGYL